MSTVDSVSSPPQLRMQAAEPKFGPDCWRSTDAQRLHMTCQYTGSTYFSILWFGPQARARRFANGPVEAGPFGLLVPDVRYDKADPAEGKVEVIEVAAGGTLELSLATDQDAEVILVLVTDDDRQTCPDLQVVEHETVGEHANA